MIEILRSRLGVQRVPAWLVWCLLAVVTLVFGLVAARAWQLWQARADRLVDQSTQALVELRSENGSTAEASAAALASAPSVSSRESSDEPLVALQRASVAAGVTLLRIESRGVGGVGGVGSPAASGSQFSAEVRAPYAATKQLLAELSRQTPAWTLDSLSMRADPDHGGVESTLVIHRVDPQPSGLASDPLR